MTELAMREHSAVAVAGDPTGDLIAWAQAAHQAHQIAIQLAETSFVPKMMQHKPGEVTGAILAGRELGLSPMSALRSIDIIDGTPAMRAHALRGLVQHHGHEVWVEETTEHRAIVCGRRRASFLGAATHVERSTWTMDRAKKAGLASKKNWQAHPTAMLVARATAEVCRLIAADVLLGMPYTIEELSDGLDGGDAPTTEAAPKRARRTAQRAPAPDVAEVEPPLDALDGVPDEPKSVGEDHREPRPVERAGWPDQETNRFYREPDAVAPELTPEPDAEPPGADPDHDEAMITRDQSKKLHATFNDLKITERDKRLAITAELVGHELASSNDLTKREASYVIDSLNDGWPPDDDGEHWDADLPPETFRNHGDPWRRTVDADTKGLT